MISKVWRIIPLILLAAGVLMAQPGNPGENPFIPIDGGLGYLLVAGLGYGIYALKKRKKS